MACLLDFPSGHLMSGYDSLHRVDHGMCHGYRQGVWAQDNID